MIRLLFYISMDSKLQFRLHILVLLTYRCSSNFRSGSGGMVKAWVREMSNNLSEYGKQVISFPVPFERHLTSPPRRP